MTIHIGYAARQRIDVRPADNSVPFPAGCTLAAQVRARRADADPLADLSTANGGIVRISDNVIELVLAAAQTSAMAAGRVVVDVVRTDLAPPAHLGFSIEIPVLLPVTRLS